MSRVSQMKATLGEFVQFTDTHLALKMLTFYESRGLNVTSARKALYAQTKLVAEERQLYENDPEAERKVALQQLQNKEDRARNEFEAIVVPQEWIDLYFSDTPESYSDEVLNAKISNGEALYVTKLTEAEKEEKKKQKIFSVERLAEQIGSEQFKTTEDLDQTLRAARDALPAAAARILESSAAAPAAAPTSAVDQLLVYMTETTLKQRVANEANAEIIEERRKEEAAAIAKRQEEEKRRLERDAAKKRQAEEARQARAAQLKKEEEERLKRLMPTASDSSDDEDFTAGAAGEEEVGGDEGVDADASLEEAEAEAEDEQPMPAAAASYTTPALSELSATVKAKLVLYFSRNNILSKLIQLSNAAAKEVQESIDAEAKSLKGAARGATSSAEASLEAARRKLAAATTMVANLEGDLKKQNIDSDAQKTADLITDAIKEASRLTVLAKARLSTLKSIEMVERKADLMYHTGSVADAEQWIKFRRMFFDVPLPPAFLWGEYFANILGVKNMDEAKRQLDELHEKAIPEFDTRPPTVSRLWLLHSSLFVFFHSVARSNHLLDFVFYSNSDSTTHGYAVLIDGRAPHLLRYLAAACIFHRKRRSPLQKTANLIRTARCRDAITEFIDLVFNKSNYEDALLKISEAAKLIEDDFFLSPHKAPLLEAMQKFVLEHIIRGRHVVSIPDIARRIGRSAEDAEPWVANLIREAEICAKIDSVKQLVLVDSATLSIAAKVLSAVESVDRIALA
jgi:hypothetical protein